MASPLRFSLSGLIAAIVVVSLYLAALRQSSAWSAQAALTLTIGLLALGLIWAIFRPKADRAFWIGFQLCGWGYVLVAFSDWSQAQLGAHLVSSRAVAALHSQMPISPSQSAMVEWHGTWYPAEVLRRDGSRSYIHYTGYGANWDEWVGPDRIRGPLGPFLQVCHALTSLVLALAGGVMASWLSTTSQSQRWFWILWGGGVATVVAAGVLGLMFDSDPAASVALSLLLVVLALATLAGWRGAPSERSFAQGLAIIGWGYFLLHYGPGLETAVGPHLLSTSVINQLHDWLHPNTATPSSGVFTYVVSSSTPYARVLYPGGTGNMWSPGGQPISSGVLAGHALLGMLLGLAGGTVALWISRSGDDKPRWGG